jgi:RNA recognition motif-containing protein
MMGARLIVFVCAISTLIVNAAAFELPVNVDGVEQILRVSEGDDLAAAASRFCSEHMLPREHEDMLLLEMQKRGFGEPAAPTTPQANLPATVKVPIIVDDQELEAEIRRGDDVQEIARQFCLKHGIDSDMQPAVADIIKNYLPEEAPRGRQEPGARTVLFSIDITLDGKNVPLTVMTGEEKNMVAVAQRFCDAHGVDAENVPTLHAAMTKELEKITSGERTGGSLPRSEAPRAEPPRATFSAPVADAAPKVQYSAPAAAKEPEFMAQRPSYWTYTRIASLIAFILVALAFLAVGAAVFQPRTVNLSWLSPAVIGGAKNHASLQMVLQRQVDKMHSFATETKPRVLIGMYEKLAALADTFGADKRKAEYTIKANEQRDEYRLLTQQHDRAAGVISAKEFAKQESFIVVPLKPGSRTRSTNKYQRSVMRTNKAKADALLRSAGGVDLDDELDLARDDVPLMGGEKDIDSRSDDTVEDEDRAKGLRLNAMGCDLDEVAPITDGNKWAIFDTDYAVRKVESDSKKAEEYVLHQKQQKEVNELRATEMKQLLIDKQKERAEKIVSHEAHGDAEEIERYERQHARAQEKLTKAARELDLKHELFVEGLPWAASEEELAKLFGGFALVAAAEAIAAASAEKAAAEGKADEGAEAAELAAEQEKEHGVESVELINSDIDGKFQGCAYIRFASTAAVDAALAFYSTEEHKERDDKSFAFRLGGRRLRLRDALIKDRREEQRQARLQMVKDMEAAEIQAALQAVHKANPKKAREYAEGKQEEEDAEGEGGGGPRLLAVPEETNDTNTGNPFEDAMNSLGLSLHTKLVVKQLVVDTVVDRMLARKDPKALAKREEERLVADRQRKARYGAFLGSQANLQEKMEAALSRGGKGGKGGKGGEGGKGGGICFAFQKGECTRGAECRFSHELESAGGQGGKGKGGPAPAAPGSPKRGHKGRKNPWGAIGQDGGGEMEHAPGDFPALEGGGMHGKGRATEQSGEYEYEESKEGEGAIDFVDVGEGAADVEQQSFQPQLGQRERKSRTRGGAAAHGEGSA